MKTLKEFLEKHDACEDGYEFAKDLTLEQFLNTCHRGDWILWLFRRSNPRNKKLRVLVAGHCANTVRHLMKDEKSIKVVDTAIAYGEGRATEEQLNAAADAYAYAAAYAYTHHADDAAYAAAVRPAHAAAGHAAYAYSDSPAARKKNQKQTADICRKYLPIELWNIKQKKGLMKYKIGNVEAEAIQWNGDNDNDINKFVESINTRAEKQDQVIFFASYGQRGLLFRELSLKGCKINLTREAGFVVYTGSSLLFIMNQDFNNMATKVKEPKFNVGDIAYYIYTTCKNLDCDKVKIIKVIDNGTQLYYESNYFSGIEEDKLFTLEEAIEKLKEL